VVLLIAVGYLLNSFQIVCNCYIGMTRILVAMSLDRLLPEWFSKVHEKYHTPMNAHLAYFLASIPPVRTRHRKLVAAAGALLAVEAFEATDGFGGMSNVYDPIDFAANALGVGLALMLDAALGRFTARRAPKQGQGSSLPAP